MLYICLTFDYELFLGKNNGSWHDVLFKPTDVLSKAMYNAGVTGTFFADVCSAIAYERMGFSDYSDNFRNQLRQLILAGHDVQLHLHTSWLLAKRKGDTVELSSDGYKIQEFGFGSHDGITADSIIRDGFLFLEETCRKVNSDYRCIAYRAGGFCIQPEEELLRTLWEYGIRMDSSVVPNMKATNVVNSYDFTKVPKKLNWRIHPKSGIMIDAEQIQDTIYEVPIATARPRLWQYIGMPKNKLHLSAVQLLGEYVIQNVREPTLVNYMMSFIHKLFDYRYISMDTRHCDRIFDDLVYIYNKYSLLKEDGYVCLICHPKVSNQERVDNICRLIEMLKADSDKRFALTTFADIYREKIQIGF